MDIEDIVDIGDIEDIEDITPPHRTIWDYRTKTLVMKVGRKK